MKFLPLSLTIWAEGTKGPENMGDSSCRRVSMEDRRPMDSDMILPSKAGRISNEKLPDIPWGAGSWSPLKIGAWIEGWQEVFCAGNLKRKKQSFKSRHFLWKEPSFGRTLPGRKKSIFPGRKHNSCKQTLAFGYLRPCWDDEDRWFPGLEGARFFSGRIRFH